MHEALILKKERKQPRDIVFPGGWLAILLHNNKVLLWVVEKQHSKTFLTLFFKNFRKADAPAPEGLYFLCQEGSVSQFLKYVTWLYTES